MKRLPSAGTAPVIAAATAIHGNKKSHVYHLATCPGYTKVKEENLVSFSTEDEAVKAGFHKAKNCPK
jgi:deoxyribonuclease-1